MGTFASHSRGLSDTSIGLRLQTDAPPLPTCTPRPRTYTLRILPEGGNENSPGWRPRQRTEPWERIATNPYASRRAARILPPHVSRVILDMMFSQENKKLRLEITLPMVLLLSRAIYASVPATCAHPIETAPYPSCHSNVGILHVSCIHREDALLIYRIASAIGNDDGKDKRRCAWSSIPPTPSAFILCSRAMPPIYSHNLGWSSGVMILRRSLVEKTQ